jgi:hypothetical protein
VPSVTATKSAAAARRELQPVERAGRSASRTGAVRVDSRRAPSKGRRSASVLDWMIRARGAVRRPAEAMVVGATRTTSTKRRTPDALRPRVLIRNVTQVRSPSLPLAAPAPSRVSASQVSPSETRYVVAISDFISSLILLTVFSSRQMIMTSFNQP